MQLQSIRRAGAVASGGTNQLGILLLVVFSPRVGELSLTAWECWLSQILIVCTKSMNQNSPLLVGKQINWGLWESGRLN